MVGGEVIDTLVLENKVWVNCHDGYYARMGKKPTKRNCCAVYVEKTAQSCCISEGDSLWWQAGHVYWTPKQNCISSDESQRKGYKCGIHYEIELKKLGYSGVKKPEPQLTK